MSILISNNSNSSSTFHHQMSMKGMMLVENERLEEKVYAVLELIVTVEEVVGIYQYIGHLKALHLLCLLVMSHHPWVDLIFSTHHLLLLPFVIHPQPYICNTQLQRCE